LSSTYTITKYSFTAVAKGSDQEVREAAAADTFEDVNGDTQLFGNVVTTHTGPGNEFGDSDGDFVSINRTKVADAVSQGFSEDDILESTFNHEIGHNLGGIHGDPSPMSKELRLYYTKPPNQIGGSGTPTVPDASVTGKFSNTIMMRIGSPRGSFNGEQVGGVYYEKGKGK